MAHPLDNIIWGALSGPLRAFSTGDDSARRLQGDFGLFAAVADLQAVPWAAVARLLHDQDAPLLVFFAPAHLEPPPAAPLDAFVRAIGLRFMAPDPLPAPDPALLPVIVRLGAADGPEMRALALETKPGPFHARTHELGAFWGIRVDGVLVAMAGERLRLPGYTEISAVCTRDGFRGRGYAAALIWTVAHHIRARGDAPLLHVAGDNTKAIELYKRLGFTECAKVMITAIRKKAV